MSIDNSETRWKSPRPVSRLCVSGIIQLSRPCSKTCCPHWSCSVSFPSIALSRHPAGDGFTQSDPKEIISSLFNLNGDAEIRRFNADLGDSAKLNLNSFNFNLNTLNEPFPLNCLYLHESVHATEGGSRVYRKLKDYFEGKLSLC